MLSEEQNRWALYISALTVEGVYLVSKLINCCF